MHNQNLLRKRIAEEQNSVTDEELFTSDAMQHFLMTMMAGITGKYEGNCHIKAIWQEQPVIGATSENGEIIINTNSILTRGKKTQERFSILKGVALHEYGHILFTDFLLFKKRESQFMEKGLLFPEPPETMNREYVKFKDYLDKASGLTPVLFPILSAFDNIIEDAFIERILLILVPGYGKSLAYTRDVHWNTMKSIQKMLTENNASEKILLSLLLQYAKYGKLKGDPCLQNLPFAEIFKKLVLLIDKAVAENNPLERARYVNAIFLLSVNHILSNSIIPSQPGNEPICTISKEVEAVNNKEILRNSPPLTQMNCITAASQQAIAKLIKEIPEGNNSPQKAEDDDSLQSIQEIKGKILEGYTKDIKTVLSSSFHNNISFQATKKQSSVNDTVYKDLSRRLRPISHRLQKNLLMQLKDYQTGGKLDGLYMGNRLEGRTLYWKDGRFFSRNILPSSFPEMAICILLDESGSMHGNKLSSARDSAFLLHDFCLALQIPIAIYGHNKQGDGIKVYSYAEFNSPNILDGLYISQMSVNGTNRDGAAIRFCLSRLSHRFEIGKYLFIISDGLPNDGLYKGSVAQADIAEILSLAVIQQVHIITAGIGDDRHHIQELYFDNISEKNRPVFLDISNLELMPKLLVKILKNSISKQLV